MWEKELEEAIKAGQKAKVKIMEFYNSTFDVEIKSDDNHERLKNDYVWIVDPVDGTKDFIARDGQFTVNIALAYKHKLVVGVVIAPATDEMYYASKDNGSYYQNGNEKPVKIHVNDKLDDLTMMISVFHFAKEDEEYIARHSDKIKHVMKKGSSLKACVIAQGLAEVTYRTSKNTKEWDTAACQIVVTEAGGLFVDLNGNEITYNREDVYNRNGYMIANRKENLLD